MAFDWKAEQDKEVDEAIAAHPDNEPAQIDAIAAIRGYFRGDENGIPSKVVHAYMAGDVSLEDAVDQLAEPIEHTYSTGDGGRLLLETELAARVERRYEDDPAVALEKWGPEEDLEALQAAVTDAEDAPTTEGQLWNLWFSLLHVAKKTPWRDAAAQQRLVALTAALKARPDPPTPVNAAVAKQFNWLGTEMWASQACFGPSGREMWNDLPGCGAGWHSPEVRAWINVNAFVARLTAQGVRDIRVYGVWALRDTLEDEITIGGHHPADSVDQMAEGMFETAAVWVRLAGRFIYERLKKFSEEDSDDEPVTFAQWNKWRQRFTEQAEKRQYTERVTGIARECAEIMAKIEEGLREDEP
ncbi:hypothetical protein DFH06DRAFT_285073 [Mycena polygramma]|nr:hypothetical protein DFH06DRAFT_285073 [Mycena polygramma]